MYDVTDHNQTTIYLLSRNYLILSFLNNSKICDNLYVSSHLIEYYIYNIFGGSRWLMMK